MNSPRLVPKGNEGVEADKLLGTADAATGDETAEAAILVSAGVLELAPTEGITAFSIGGTEDCETGATDEETGDESVGESATSDPGAATKDEDTVTEAWVSGVLDVAASAAVPGTGTVTV